MLVCISEKINHLTLAKFFSAAAERHRAIIVKYNELDDETI